MSGKVRIGVIGASSRPHGWAARAHLPAIAASEDVELAAVCTTRRESAEESARKFGAELAFDDYREMLAREDIEAVSVVVRVPSHHQVAKDALLAGKPVYTEWPLGRTTEEAVELAELAAERGIVTAVGLQARVHPAYRYVRDLIADGHIGEVLSCRASTVTSGALAKRTDFAWSAAADTGANTLTVTNGHTLDTVVFLLGGAVRTLSAQTTTQVKQWHSIDADEYVDVDAPDTVIVTGTLTGGATFSSYASMVPFAGEGFRIEVYGRKGTLTIQGDYHPQNSDPVLRVALGTNALKPLEVPAQYVTVPRVTETIQPYGVGVAYHEFARSIRGEEGAAPDFAVAVTLHRLLDAIRQSSASGAVVTLG
ncbi:Gfo/Idh/MocA family protein [Actinacidiphila reveromycinica]|nr:Gfo/Idh/MocA family oxidoreductase [Streptomyces sp. SN-593]